MTVMPPKQLAASAMTLLLMAAETMTIATRPDSSRERDALARVGAISSSLAAGDTAHHPVAFEKGREYHVVGVCGPGCLMELRLYSPSGREIDRHSGGGMPEVAVIPSSSATYRADVTMKVCPVAPCAYTLDLLVR